MAIVQYDSFIFAPEQLRHAVVYPYMNKGKDTEAFNQWLAKLQSDEVGRVAYEFEILTKTLREHKNSTDVWKRNAEYNRYNDMVCFDQTRVSLSDGLQPDYIHANWVNGFHRRNAYILTQGPLDNTVVDFWRMIWQEGIATIVMVTRLEEKGRPKCSRYFPVSNEVDFQAGFFKVELKKVEKRKLCLASLMAVTNLITNETNHVVHVWYTSWPDQGVPDDLDSLRHFLNYVKLINANMAQMFYKVTCRHKRGPAVVYHCSAGIGRSAALVALDIITEAMTHNHHVDVFELVIRMRRERFHSIHTKIQLLFVYDYVVALAAHQRHQLVQRIQ